MLSDAFLRRTVAVLQETHVNKNAPIKKTAERNLKTRYMLQKAPLLVITDTIILDFDCRVNLFLYSSKKYLSYYSYPVHVFLLY